MKIENRPYSLINTSSVMTFNSKYAGNIPLLHYPEDNFLILRAGKASYCYTHNKELNRVSIQKLCRTGKYVGTKTPELMDKDFWNKPLLEQAEMVFKTLL